jgi:hypothetical protein
MVVQLPAVFVNAEDAVAFVSEIGERGETGETDYREEKKKRVWYVWYVKLPKFWLFQSCQNHKSKIHQSPKLTDAPCFLAESCPCFLQVGK